MRKVNLNEIKEIEFEILLVFKDFCEKNDLNYFLVYGTLLGAVRHKGFIPWDDDIDVAMPRKDYERFLNLFSHHKYKLLNHHSEPNYYYPFAKLVDSDTLLVEKTVKKIFKMGIYIDIFPIDGIPSNENQFKNLLKNISREKKELHLKTIGYNKSKNLLKTVIKYMILTFYHLKSSYKRNTNKIENLCSFYEFDKSEFAGITVWGEGEKEKVPSLFYKEYILLEFNKQYFRAPKEYNIILQSIYNQYMILPPIEERKTHPFEAYIIEGEENESSKEIM